MLTNHCRSRTFRITDMPERPTTQAPGDACDACRRDWASRMALMAIRGRAKPALANLQPWLHTLRPRLEVLLEQGASEASVGRWHEAALRARVANELLAGALRPVYADPRRSRKAGRPAQQHLPCDEMSLHDHPGPRIPGPSRRNADWRRTRPATPLHSRLHGLLLRRPGSGPRTVGAGEGHCRQNVLSPALRTARPHMSVICPSTPRRQAARQ